MAYRLTRRHPERYPADALAGAGKSRPPEGNGGSGPGGTPPRRKRRTLVILPTLCTLANVLCGFGAIFMASRSPATPLPWGWTPLALGAVLIFLGMVFDGLDGALARMTRATSPMGAQLDSMADMLTFGAAPAFLAIQLVGIGTPFVVSDSQADSYFDRMTLVVAAIYVSCAALRLARFNSEVKSASLEDHLYFKGLPSPGAAGTIAGLVLLQQHFGVGLAGRLTVTAVTGAKAANVIEPSIMLGTTLLAGLAMVSRVRYVHFVNRFVRGRASVRYIAGLVALVLLSAIDPVLTLAAGFLIYALSGPVTWVWSQVTPKPAVAPLSTAPTPAP